MPIKALVLVKLWKIARNCRNSKKSLPPQNPPELQKFQKNPKNPKVLENPPPRGYQKQKWPNPIKTLVLVGSEKKNLETAESPPKKKKTQKMLRTAEIPKNQNNLKVLGEPPLDVFGKWGGV